MGIPSFYKGQYKFFTAEDLLLNPYHVFSRRIIDYCWTRCCRTCVDHGVSKVHRPQRFANLQRTSGGIAAILSNLYSRWQKGLPEIPEQSPNLQWTSGWVHPLLSEHCCSSSEKRIS